MISLEGDALEEVIFQNLKFFESSVQFLSINGISQEEGSKSVTLSNISFSGLKFTDRFSTILQTGGFLRTNQEIQFLFSDLSFQNITFSEYGELMRIRHQTVEPLIVDRLSVSEVEGGKISLDAAHTNNNGVLNSVLF